MHETAVVEPNRLIGKEDEAERVFAVVRETKYADGSVTSE